MRHDPIYSKVPLTTSRRGLQIAGNDNTGIYFIFIFILFYYFISLIIIFFLWFLIFDFFSFSFFGFLILRIFIINISLFYSPLLGLAS